MKLNHPQSAASNDAHAHDSQFQHFPAASTVDAAERDILQREALLQIMINNLKEYLDAAQMKSGIGYRLTDRCGNSIAEYDDAAGEIVFDQGFAGRLSVPKVDNFGANSVQALVDGVFRHECHHRQGLDEAAARAADIDYYRWETHRSEARLKECIMLLNVLQNETIGLEVDPSYINSMHVLLPALTNFAMQERLKGGPDGQLAFMIVDGFMRKLRVGGSAT